MALEITSLRPSLGSISHAIRSQPRLHVVNVCDVCCPAATRRRRGDSRGGPQVRVYDVWPRFANYRTQRSETSNQSSPIAHAAVVAEEHHRAATREIRQCLGLSAKYAKGRLKSIAQRVGDFDRHTFRPATAELRQHMQHTSSCAEIVHVARPTVTVLNDLYSSMIWSI